MSNLLHTELPLRYQTPTSWAGQALSDPIALLNDHAHLEKKAASNALELLSRWPAAEPPETWVSTLTSIASDEAVHLRQVSRILENRNGSLDRAHRNPYTMALRECVRLGQGTEEVLDRLLVSALIEARSCERFGLLADDNSDPELRKLYKGLWSSELGHYTAFLTLANDIVPQREIDERWDWMLDKEATIIRKQPPGPRMHSGVAESSHD